MSTSPEDIAGLCLCSDHLSDDRKLDEWWKRQVAGVEMGSQMTPLEYTVLTARYIKDISEKYFKGTCY